MRPDHNVLRSGSWVGSAGLDGGGQNQHNPSVPASITIADVRVLPASRPRALTAQAGLLLAAAVALPALAHLTGLPVRTLLPMHWPVILAGLCYGWRSGAVLGALAPLTSYLLSGMPPPVILPPMTLELAAYGMLAGLVREVLGRGRVEATLGAVLGGRILFVGAMLASGTIVGPLADYLRNAMAAGLPAALAQVLLLPPLAAWWVRRESQAAKSPRQPPSSSTDSR